MNFQMSTGILKNLDSLQIQARKNLSKIRGHEKNHICKVSQQNLTKFGGHLLQTHVNMLNDFQQS